MTVSRYLRIYYQLTCLYTYRLGDSGGRTPRNIVASNISVCYITAVAGYVVAERFTVLRVEVGEAHAHAVRVGLSHLCDECCNSI